MTNALPYPHQRFCINTVVSGHATDLASRHDRQMLTQIYIEALLANEELADEVWEL